MADAILATKLFRPQPQPNAVQRPRLRERLDDGRHRKLTLISAPAGFGKTTTVSDWLSASGKSDAWFSLDESDGDPTRFLTYFIAALQSIDASIGQGVLGVLQSPQPPPNETILTALLNDVAAVSGDFTLVLDDYHVIDARPVDDALAFLLEHMPPQMHLVIATREDPHLPLARLRARGQLTELRAADLRFTPAEAAEFLNQVMDLNLSADDIAALESRTEGWIAGLQLAALSIQGREDVHGFLRAFAGDDRYIVDYLIEEVLQRQPDRVRHFLLQTSVLGRLSGPLCDAVTGQDDGKGLLETLERANLFVVPLDNKRHWYRYHHLFADVLQAHAMQEHPHQVPVWHKRASEWYEQNGLPSDAIRHALLGEDFGRAAGLVELESLEMLMTRQDATFHGWLNALPNEYVCIRPVLSAYYALSLVSFDLEAAEPRLQDAERLLNGVSQTGERPESSTVEMEVSDEVGYQSLPGLINIVRAYRAGAFGDIRGIVEYAHRALDLLPEDSYLWRGAAAALLGLAYWGNGDLEAAHRSFTDGISMLRKTGDVTQSVSGAVILANIRTAQGRLRDAAEIYEQSMQSVVELGEPIPPPTADLYVGMSELSREHNDLETASRHLLSSRELSEHGGIVENRHRWCIAMAGIKEAQGDLDRALELLDEAERLYTRSPDPVVRPFPALKARVWIRQGRMTKALEWAAEQGLAIDDDLSYIREFEHITLARLLLAQYRRNGETELFQEAVKLLDRLLKAAEEGQRIGSQIEILTLQALALEARDDIAQALAPLERALALGEPEGYVRIFVDEGMPMARLLSETASRGIMPEYVGKLLSAFEPESERSDERHSRPPATPAQPLIEPLSEREIEVLHFIAQGLSNRQISERLFLALSTVKGHNRVIFGKLQVQRRTEAVARARELGIL